MCGFRTIRFDAKEGFFLNDQPLKLQGTCNHQDHAGVGVAVPDSILGIPHPQIEGDGRERLSHRRTIRRRGSCSKSAIAWECW